MFFESPEEDILNEILFGIRRKTKEFQVRNCVLENDTLYLLAKRPGVGIFEGKDMNSIPYSKIERKDADHIQAQNERNEKTRHTERNRTLTDLLTNSKTCP